MNDLEKAMPVSPEERAAETVLSDETAVTNQLKSSEISEEILMDTEESEITEETDKDPRKYHSLDKEGLINELRRILSEEQMESHKEVTALKQAFYNIKTRENLERLNAFIDAGNNPADYASEADELENEFKNLYAEFKDKRAAYLEADAARKGENLKKKNEILENLQDITEDIDNVNIRFQDFQKLQQEFKDIKDIPASAETETWKRFQSLTEKFYDHLKMNKELRDLDFKKNLEAKKLLISEARKLEEVEDPVSAFRSLQGLHEEWRNIGPVAKDIRESIWEEFRTISGTINKRHQEYFERRKAEEQVNEEAKTKLCEEVEGIKLDEIKNFSDWNSWTDKVIELQKKWKECGFASRKVNTALYSRFREACDKFFNTKSEFIRTTREALAENLERKIKLCEKAESLVKSEDTSKAAAEIRKLQAEWKTIGSVPRKQSDEIWNRFQAACNQFFNDRKQENKKRFEEENANMESKKEIISQLRELPKDGERKEVIGKVKELQAKWQEIGFVPYKYKEQLYKEYRSICDELYGAYDSKESRTRIANFKSRISDLKGDGKEMGREIDKLYRALDSKKSELQTIENNMGFFNVKSSAGNSLVKEMERKIKRLKDDISEINQKIEMLRNEE